MAVTPSGLHTMLSGLHEGMLTLSGICVIIIVIAKLYRRFLGKILYIDVEKIIKYAEPTSVVGAIGGSVFLVVSAYVGFTITGGVGSLVNSPLLMNKVMMSIFALELWVVFLIVRFKYGGKVWNYGGLSVVYAIIGVAAWLFVVETGSLGGHLAGTGSVIDSLYELVGVDPTQFLALGTLGIYALIGICILAGIIFTYVHWRSRAR